MLLILNYIYNCFTFFSHVIVDHKNVLAILLFVAMYSRHSAFRVATCVATCIILNYVLKEIIKKPLPIETPLNFTAESWQVVRSRTFSMPSGHMNFSTVFVLSIMIEFYKVKNFFLTNRYFKGYMKYIISSLFVFFYFLLGAILIFSGYRIVSSGYHFTDDVIVGFIVGLCHVFVNYKFVFKKDKFINLYITMYSAIGVFASRGYILTRQNDYFVKVILLLFLLLVAKNTGLRLKDNKKT
jgi:membrane-associated phospholipid phosphatase